MQEKISYSHLFVCLDEIISYLKSIDYSNTHIEALQQIQQALVALELMNISVHQWNLLKNFII